jgi:hypothetical protein
MGNDPNTKLIFSSCYINELLQQHQNMLTVTIYERQLQAF